ncbi:hypothetical protein Tco_0961771 [Tanacetum coccineum]
MTTRSSGSRLLSPIEDHERLLSRRNRSEPSLLFDLEEDDIAGQVPSQGPIPDLRSMEELLQAPTDGVGDAIVIDTFYNGLNQPDQASLNSTAGVLSASGRSTQDAAITALIKQVEVLVSSKNRLINSIQNGCKTCGGPHAYYECQAAGGYTQEDIYATMGTYNAGENSYQPQDLKKVLMERPQGVLPSNTVLNPQEEIKAITTQSDIVLVEPSVPLPHLSSSSKEVEQDPETITDQLPSPVSSPSEPSKRNPHQPPILYPSRLNKEKLQDKSDIQSISSFKCSRNFTSISVLPKL